MGPRSDLFEAISSLKHLQEAKISIEYALLAQLAGNVGRVLTTRLLLQRVWRPQYHDATDYIKGVIRRLRVKLEPDPAHPQYIITEPHLGYRLNDAL